MAPKLFHLWCHSKNLQPPTKNFFWVQSTRLAYSFEPLNSFLAQLAEELGQLLVLGQFQSTNISYPGSQSVKISRQDPTRDLQFETETRDFKLCGTFCCIKKMSSSLQFWLEFFFKFLAFFRPVLVVPYLQIQQTKIDEI